jgi:hypothetical protein
VQNPPKRHIFVLTRDEVVGAREKDKDEDVDVGVVEGGGVDEVEKE